MRLVGAVGLLSLSACSSFPDFDFAGQGSPATSASDRAALPQAQVPVYAAGDVYTYDEDGTTVQERVVSVSPDRVVWRDQDTGVIWTRDPYVVTPPLNWSGHPELGRGQQTILGSPEQLFPLKEGNIIAYTIRGSSETIPEGWEDQHRCAVVGQDTVEVKAGAFSTFRIDCQRRDYLDRIYYSPVVQNVVLREREFAGRTSRKELIAVSLSNDNPAIANAPLAEPAPPAPVPVPADSPNAVRTNQVNREMAMEKAAAAEVSNRLAQLERAVRRLEQSMGLTPLVAAKPMADGAAMPGEVMLKDKGDGAAMADEKMAGPWGIHLASYRALSRARAGWGTLSNKFPQLGNLSMRTSEFDPGNGRGTYVRLLGVGFPTRDAALSFCRPIKSAGQFCEPKGPLPG